MKKIYRRLLSEVPHIRDIYDAKTKEAEGAYLAPLSLIAETTPAEEIYAIYTDCGGFIIICGILDDAIGYALQVTSDFKTAEALSLFKEVLAQFYTCNLYVDKGNDRVYATCLKLLTKGILRTAEDYGDYVIFEAGFKFDLEQAKVV